MLKLKKDLYKLFILERQLVRSFQTCKMILLFLYHKVLIIVSDSFSFMEKHLH